MAKYHLHTAASRGHADHGWLKSAQSFSFAGYYNQERMHFGALRVLNDDVVEGGKGFGGHPHDNMEIISIPLEGALEHKDNMGNVRIVRPGDIQVMSTGTGVFHSEYNANPDKPAAFLQIWVFPRQLNTVPRYDQVSLRPEDRLNTLQQIISPDPKGAGIWIGQDAWFSIGRFNEGVEASYQLHSKENGLYLFVIEGAFTVDGQALGKRDAMGVEQVDNVSLRADSERAELLLIEVPMTPLT